MFATIYLPNFYLQAAIRHQPELRTQPVALIEEDENKPVIIQLNHPAEFAGVRKGMTPSQALARYLQVVIKTRERAQEKLINDILIQHAFTLSPFVESTAPGICTIQFGTQLSRLSAKTGSLSSKLSRVIEQLANCEITAQGGIASLPDASFLAAHLARPVLQLDDVKEFLAPLPIETLAMTNAT
jgi:protein ImuB